MLLLLLILIPAITGIFSFAWKSESVKIWGLLSALASTVVAIMVFFAQKEGVLLFEQPWLPSLGAHFSLSADGMVAVLAMLTALVYLITFIVEWNKPLANSPRFIGLMLLSQAGITGTFLANDLLLFYFCWELALIPVYFMGSIWNNGEGIKTMYKFFVYTFLGSMMMLGGIIYLYLHTPNLTFDYTSIVAAGQQMTTGQQQGLFWCMFLAFAVKMPIFPFHTWQPDTYEKAATPITIVLSALMVKMGLFAAFKWLLPVFPQGVAFWSDTVIILCLIGIIYASFLALVQDDLKRFVAYSSIAHVSLMCLAIFSQTDTGTNGSLVYDAVTIQMFNHGVNITGMWILVSIIEHRYGTRKMSELGGLGAVAPTLVGTLVIIAYANIALPLTNAFVGEFMLYHSIFQSDNPNHIVYMILAGTGIVLGAVYTLKMVQKVAYGELGNPKEIVDVRLNEMIGLVAIIVMIVVLGVYPDLIFGMMG